MIRVISIVAVLSFLPGMSLALGGLPGTATEGVEIEDLRCIRDRVVLPIADCKAGDQISFTATVTSNSPDVVLHFAVYHNETGLFGRCQRPRYLKIGLSGRSQTTRLRTEILQSIFVPPLTSGPRSFTLWVRVNDGSNGESIFEDSRVLNP